MRILIAEDERITRVSLQRQLESWGHAVVATEDGEQAWERFTDGNFDLVLTDWEMPRLSGVELIQRIRSTPQTSYVYLMMLTGRSNKADLVRGIEAGADDFVPKPFDREELRVRLLAGERVVRLERTLSKQNAELRDANHRIHVGLQAAARVQRSMLPRSCPETPRVRTAWNYVPSEELAGDAVGLHLIDDRYLVSYVIDVSGHGVPAALLSVTAMHRMDPVAGASSLTRDMSGSAGIGTVQRPAKIAEDLNRLFRTSDNDGRYLTMGLVVLDTLTGQLHLTSAGHPPAVILRGQSAIDVPDSGGLPIAIMDDSTYEQATLQLQPGDRVFMFSDGLIEQTRPNDSEQFGADRITRFFGAHSQLPLSALLGRLVAELAEWSQVTTFVDDVSVVAVEWLGG